MENKKYHFKLLKKCIIWDEYQFATEAPTFEEAKQKAMEFYNDPNETDTLINDDYEQELVLHTLQDYEPEDNFYPTKELYYYDFDTDEEKLILTG